MITINDKQYKIKQTIRSLFLFELITGKAFEVKTMLDNYIFFYCVILANNPNEVLDWDEFLDAIDDNPTLLVEFAKMMLKQDKLDALLATDTDSEKKS